ncbi:hypothetical protein D9611_006545 [Ephemerocybe angulata]|uniref:Uncharacterized protein n=1 Tax=Ephemerocybe angulata TaxID=980116 RepID=A0A8H5C7U4_9AGAR|nr:hypothetical protein D9611_006545 [Tulosesus angulatus]
MEAVRNCFGGKRHNGVQLEDDSNSNSEDDDSSSGLFDEEDNPRETLLSKHPNPIPSSHTFQSQIGTLQREPPPRRRRHSHRRMVDLEIPADTPPHRETPNPPPQGGYRKVGVDMGDGGERKSGLEKVVDCFAALSAGKVPSQEQLKRMLRVLLNSDLFTATAALDAEGSGAFGNMAGNGTGPMSRRGRQVIQDARGVVQALLEFTVEKNDDNKIQDLVHNLALISSGKTGGPNPLSNVNASVNLNLDQAAESSKDALKAGQQAAGQVVDQIPPSAELQADAQILLHTLHTLTLTLLTSPIFRALLSDILSILRSLVAHGARDVKDAAGGVQRAAEGVEERVEKVDVGRGAEVSYAAVVSLGHAVGGGGRQEGGGEGGGSGVGLGEVARKTAKGAYEGVGEAAETVKERVGEKAGEWREAGKEAKEEVKNDFAERMQQVLVQAAGDPASRKALRAILILVRKYAGKVEAVRESVVEAAGQIGEDVERGGMGSVGVNVEVGVDAGSTTREERKEALNYPPPASLYPSVDQTRVKTDKNAAAKTKGPPPESPVERAFGDLKVLLERVGKGRSLDGVLARFGRLVRDLNELPVQAGVPIDVKGKEKEKERWEERGLVESTSTASVETVRPSGSQQSTNQETKKKGKKGRKARRKGKEAEIAGVSIEAEESQDDSEREDSQRAAKTNPIRVYFSDVGEFLDRALDEPGLVEGGVELFSVVGDVVADTVEVSSEAGDHELSSRESEHQPSESGDGDPSELRRRFREDAKGLVEEIQAYVEAVESDRTSMKLLKAVESLSASLTELLSPVNIGLPNTASTAKTAKQALWSSLEWTEWVAWALPKLVKMIPVGVVPVPSLEAKSESGGWEAGLYALFVRGNAEAKARRRHSAVGRFPSPRGEERGAGAGSTPRGGIESTLVPDNVTVREWTEVRVDFAAVDSGRDSEEEGDGGRAGEGPPRVERTSRVRVEVGGVRAKVEGVGYYFKYGGDWVGYEDEGIVNVDLGMDRGVGGGFGCEIELEVRNASGESEGGEGEKSRAPGRKRPVSRQCYDGGGSLDILLGEGLEGEGEIAAGVLPADVLIPQLLEEEEEEVAANANLDVQRALASSDSESVSDSEDVGGARTRAAALKSGVPVSQLDRDMDIQPLFDVVDVKVHMRGVKVRLEQSRHWILNKVVVQPLAGPAVGAVVRRLVEEELKKRIGDLGLWLGRVKVDAEARGQARKEEARRMRAAERRAKVGRMVREGRGLTGEDEERLRRLDEEDVGGGEEEGWVGLLEDWAFAILKNGGRLFEGKEREEEEENGVGTETRSEIGVTRKGVVYHQEAVPSPEPVVFNKKYGIMEPVASEESGETESDLTLAVGGGPQLFPDKAVPYGARNDQEDVRFVNEGRRLVSAAKQTANVAASEAMGSVAYVGARFNARRKEEERPGWYSDAFDL